MAYLYGAVLAAALCGLAVSVYVRYKKARNEVLVCPLNFECEDVIHSKYSAILGIPIEVFGLLYYSLFMVAYGAALVAPGIITAPMFAGLAVIAFVAMMFSVYLLYVQVLLREWCIWCLASFFASLIIFYLVVLA
jgi:uncharacterized membrane protein